VISFRKGNAVESFSKYFSQNIDFT